MTWTDEPDRMRARWLRTMNRFCPRWESFYTVRQYYGEEHRRYHTLDHLERLFGTIDSASFEPDLEAELAAWYHDLVYDTWTGAANEAASAALADREMIRMGLEEPARRRVRDLILLTAKHPNAVPTDKQAALLLDADLSSLGAAPEVFDRDSRAIREEYGHVYEPVFLNARYFFLASCDDALALNELYHLPEFQSRFNASAKANIDSAIAQVIRRLTELRIRAGTTLVRKDDVRFTVVYDEHLHYHYIRVAPGQDAVERPDDVVQVYGLDESGRELYRSETVEGRRFYIRTT